MTTLEEIKMLDVIIDEKDKELEIEKAENLRLCNDQRYTINLWNEQHEEIKRLNNIISILMNDASEQGIDLCVPNGKEHIQTPY